MIRDVGLVSGGSVLEPLLQLCLGAMSHAAAEARASREAEQGGQDSKPAVRPGRRARRGAEAASEGGGVAGGAALGGGSSRGVGAGREAPSLAADSHAGVRSASPLPQVLPLVEERLREGALAGGAGGGAGGLGDAAAEEEAEEAGSVGEGVAPPPASSALQRLQAISEALLRIDPEAAMEVAPIAEGEYELTEARRRVRARGAWRCAATPPPPLPAAPRRCGCTATCFKALGPPLPLSHLSPLGLTPLAAAHATPHSCTQVHHRRDGHLEDSVRLRGSGEIRGVKARGKKTEEGWTGHGARAAQRDYLLTRREKEKNGIDHRAQRSELRGGVEGGRHADRHHAGVGTGAAPLALVHLERSGNLTPRAGRGGPARRAYEAHPAGGGCSGT